MKQKNVNITAAAKNLSSDRTVIGNVACDLLYEKLVEQYKITQSQDTTSASDVNTSKKNTQKHGIKQLLSFTLLQHVIQSIHKFDIYNTIHTDKSYIVKLQNCIYNTIVWCHQRLTAQQLQSTHTHDWITIACLNMSIKCIPYIWPTSSTLTPPTSEPSSSSSSSTGNDNSTTTSVSTQQQHSDTYNSNILYMLCYYTIHSNTDLRHSATTALLTLSQSLPSAYYTTSTLPTPAMILNVVISYLNSLPYTTAYSNNKQLREHTERHTQLILTLIHQLFSNYDNTIQQCELQCDSLIKCWSHLSIAHIESSLGIWLCHSNITIRRLAFKCLSTFRLMCYTLKEKLYLHLHGSDESESNHHVNNDTGDNASSSIPALPNNMNALDITTISNHKIRMKELKNVIQSFNQVLHLTSSIDLYLQPASKRIVSIVQYTNNSNNAERHSKPTVQIPAAIEDKLTRNDEWLDFIAAWLRESIDVDTMQSNDVSTHVNVLETLKAMYRLSAVRLTTLLGLDVSSALSTAHSAVNVDVDLLSWQTLATMCSVCYAVMANSNAENAHSEHFATHHVAPSITSNNTTPSASTHVAASTTPIQSQPLYTRFASLLYHEKLSIRRLASIALGNVHSSMVMKVLESLPSIAVDKLATSNSASYAITVLTGKHKNRYNNGNASKKKKEHEKASDRDDEYHHYIQRSEWTRTHVAHVYTLLATHLSNDILSGHHEVRVKYIRFISDVYGYFQSAPVNEYRWDTIELRQDYATVIQHIANALEQPVQFNATDKWYLPPPQQHGDNASAQISQSAQSPSSPRTRISTQPLSLGQSDASSAAAQQPFSYDTLTSECRSQLFEQLLAWCGYGPSSAAYSMHVQQHSMEVLTRAASSSSSHHNNKQHTIDQLASALKQQIDTVQQHALLTMSSLLKASCFDHYLCKQLNASAMKSYNANSADEHTKASMLMSSSDDNKSLVLQWLNAILISKEENVRDIGYKSLEWMIKHNVTLLPAFIGHCYARQSVLSRRYFLVVSQMLIQQLHAAVNGESKSGNVSSDGYEDVDDDKMLAMLLHLVIYKCGDNSSSVRRMALRLLSAIEFRYSIQISDSLCTFISPRDMMLQHQVRYLQTLLAKKLSIIFADIAHIYCIEACMRIHTVLSTEQQIQILESMLPWLQRIQLTAISTQHTDMCYDACPCVKHVPRSTEIDSNGNAKHIAYPSVESSCQLIKSLLTLTNRLVDSKPIEIESMWLSLLRTYYDTTNVIPILTYILQDTQTRSLSDTSTRLIYLSIAWFSGSVCPRSSISLLSTVVADACQNIESNNGDLLQWSLLMLAQCIPHGRWYASCDEDGDDTQQLSKQKNKKVKNSRLSSIADRCHTLDLSSLPSLLHIGTLLLCYKQTHVYASGMLVQLVQSLAFPPQIYSTPLLHRNHDEYHNSHDSTSALSKQLAVSPYATLTRTNVNNHIITQLTKNNNTNPKILARSLASLSMKNMQNQHHGDSDHDRVTDADVDVQRAAMSIVEDLLSHTYSMGSNEWLISLVNSLLNLCGALHGNMFLFSGWRYEALDWAMKSSEWEHSSSSGGGSNKSASFAYSCNCYQIYYTLLNNQSEKNKEEQLPVDSNTDIEHLYTLLQQCSRYTDVLSVKHKDTDFVHTMTQCIYVVDLLVKQIYTHIQYGSDRNDDSIHSLYTVKYDTIITAYWRALVIMDILSRHEDYDVSLHTADSQQRILLLTACMNTVSTTLQYAHDDVELQESLCHQQPHQWLNQRGGIQSLLLAVCYHNYLPALAALSPSASALTSNGVLSIHTLTHDMTTNTSSAVIDTTPIYQKSGTFKRLSQAARFQQQQQRRATSANNNNAKKSQHAQANNQLGIDLLDAAIRTLSLLPITTQFAPMLLPLSPRHASLLNITIILPWLHAQCERATKDTDTRSVHIPSLARDVAKNLSTRTVTSQEWYTLHEVLEGFGRDGNKNSSMYDKAVRRGEASDLLWAHLMEPLGQCIPSDSVIILSMLLCDTITALDGGIWDYYHSYHDDRKQIIEGIQYHTLQLIDIYTASQYTDTSTIHTQHYSQQLFARIGKLAHHANKSLSTLALQMLNTASQRVHGQHSTRWLEQLDTWKQVAYKYSAEYVPTVPDTPVTRLLTPYLKDKQPHKRVISVNVSCQTPVTIASPNTHTVGVGSNPREKYKHGNTLAVPNAAVREGRSRTHSNSISTSTSSLQVTIDGNESDQEEFVLMRDDKRCSLPRGVISQPRIEQKSINSSNDSFINKMHQKIEKVWAKTKQQQPYVIGSKPQSHNQAAHTDAEVAVDAAEGNINSDEMKTMDQDIEGQKYSNAQQKEDVEKNDEYRSENEENDYVAGNMNINMSSAVNNRVASSSSAAASTTDLASQSPSLTVLADTVVPTVARRAMPAHSKLRRPAVTSYVFQPMSNTSTLKSSITQTPSSTSTSASATASPSLSRQPSKALSGNKLTPQTSTSRLHTHTPTRLLHKTPQKETGSIRQKAMHF